MCVGVCLRVQVLEVPRLRRRKRRLWWRRTEAMEVVPANYRGGDYSDSGDYNQQSSNCGPKKSGNLGAE